MVCWLKTNKGSDSRLEPITNLMQKFGNGGATQAVTKTPITDFIVTQVKQ